MVFITLQLIWENEYGKDIYFFEPLHDQFEAQFV